MDKVQKQIMSVSDMPLSESYRVGQNSCVYEAPQAQRALIIMRHPSAWSRRTDCHQK